MSEKPSFFASEHAEVFKHQDVAESYRYRPPYPVELFDVLTSLIHTEPRRVLDVGCGSGFLARTLIERVDSIDAVDFSQAMIAEGKRLPNGDHPHLRWLYGAIEEIALNPPYALVTAGESFHWMDWDIVLPRFRELLVPGGYLAIVNKGATPDPWSILSEVVPQYTTNKGSRRDVVKELEERGLFQKVGEHRTTPVAFVQSIDDYIASYHSRSGFSRERMGQGQANTFDREAREALLHAYPDGVITFQIVGNVVWGMPY